MDSWVLTAGHCVKNNPTDASVYTVVVGEHDMSNSSDLAKNLSMKSVTMHPMFKPGKNEDAVYDFALLELTEMLTFSREVKPVCLPQDPTKDYAGVVATVAGWGVTTPHRQDRQDANPVLKKVNVTVLANGSCGDVPKEDNYQPEVELCAADEGKDSCQGDSGGPLMMLENGRYTEIGLVSFSEGCARKGFPGVYARVDAVLDWIENTTAGTVLCVPT